jgi:UDP-glucuronate decarboxylase
VDRLLSQGHTVYVLDSFGSGRPGNLTRAQGSSRLNVVEHDITRPLPDGLPRFNQIYNLACPASPPHYQKDPIATLMVSSLGVKNMLDRAAADGARVFHASTSEVYGDPDRHPQSEDYNGNVNLVGPRSCYNNGKRFAETLLTDYSRERNVTVRIARIFNTYGPRMQSDDGRVVSNFIVQALTGEKVTIYGDGSQTRSFCYVDDMIEGFMRLMHAGPEAGGPVNIGNPTERTVKQLAELIVQLTGSKSRIEFLPLPVDDPRKRCPDISRARAILGWSPKVNLIEGLRATIAYFAADLGKIATAKIA